MFLVRQAASFPIVGPHEHAIHFRNSLLALFAPEDGLHVHYLVALLNSRLLRFVYTETVRESQQRTFPQVKLAALRSLPMRKIDLANAEERAEHDALVQLVDDALAVQRRAAAEKNPIRREALQRHFETVDGEIDRRVFALYALSAAEIALVESAVAPVAEAEKPSSWRPEAAGQVGGPKPSGKARPVGEPRKTRAPAAVASRAKSGSRH